MGASGQRVDAGDIGHHEHGMADSDALSTKLVIGELSNPSELRFVND